MNIKMQPFVLQHQCLRFAAIAYQAALGLELVLKKKKLPSNYCGVFSQASALCKDIVENLYYSQSDSINPHTVQVLNGSDAALWFYSLIRCHPKIYKGLESYEDILSISEVLELFATDPNSRKRSSVASIRAIKGFFSALCDAVTEEFRREGVAGELDFTAFHEVSNSAH